MLQTIRSEAILASLLDALERERFARAPLLRTIADELATFGHDEASVEASALAARVEREPLSDETFGLGLIRLRAKVDGALFPPRRTRRHGRRRRSTRPVPS